MRSVRPALCGVAGLRVCVPRALPWGAAASSGLLFLQLCLDARDPSDFSPSVAVFLYSGAQIHGEGLGGPTEGWGHRVGSPYPALPPRWHKKHGRCTLSPLGSCTCCSSQL